MRPEIITTVLTTGSTIIVAVLNFLSNRKIKKLADLKQEIRKDIEDNEKKDVLRYNELLRKMEKLNDIIDQNDIDTVRNRIVNFDNICRLDPDQIRRYQYSAIFKDIKKWEKYHCKYKSLNGEIDIAIENIKKCYENNKE